MSSGVVRGRRTRLPLERVRSSVRKLGFDVVRFRSDVASYQSRLLTDQKIDLVVDVGANTGQYAGRLRLLGYAGRIVSFEPGAAAFATLDAAASHDGGWHTRRVGVSDRAGSMQLHVSGNSVSSSLLEMEALHFAADSRSAYVATEQVPVDSLDSLLADELASRLWLKVDVQGYEMPVLRGASRSLAEASVVQCELSLRPMYQGGSTLVEVCTYLDEHGFDLRYLEPGFKDPRDGALLQADGIFVRRSTS